jgi:hypothetical protein
MVSMALDQIARSRAGAGSDKSAFSSTYESAGTQANSTADKSPFSPAMMMISSMTTLC